MHLNLKPMCSLHVFRLHGHGGLLLFFLSLLSFLSLHNEHLLFLKCTLGEAARPLMWPCYRGDVMTCWLVVTVTTGRPAPEVVGFFLLLLSGITSSGMMSSGVVLVPVLSWKSSKISLTKACPYLHAHTTSVRTDHHDMFDKLEKY